MKHRITIKVDAECEPLFYRPRCVPFRYRCHVKEELVILDRSEILERMDHYSWGCPIVAVLKTSGKIRICTKYAQTINKFTKQ